MDKQIWKYVLEPETIIEMPIGAEILTVQEQYGRCCLWALVDPSANKVKRKFLVYGTGHPITEENGKYIGTFQLHNGRLVFHVFEYPM